MSSLPAERRSDAPLPADRRGTARLVLRTAAISVLLSLPLAMPAAAAETGPAGGWAETVLLHFPSGRGGANPAAGLTPGRGGALYGTVANGGASGFGAVFELRSAAAGGSGTMRLVYSFGGGADGGHPMAGVIAGNAGQLYGTTLSGGASGHGAVFELTPPATPEGAWVERVLYSFGGAGDGGSPSASLAADATGALYGTTISGGAHGRGVVFKLAPQTGGAWAQSVLHSFGGGGDGELPFAGVTIGASNLLYGTTTYGGSAGFGSVFALTPPNSGSGWSLRVLYSFTGKADGGLPAAGVVIDRAGGLYGTTRWGGDHASGVVFRLNPPAAPGQGWSEVVLHSFGSGFGSGDDGGAPLAGVVFDAAGGLYGTTDRGGAHGRGTVYRLSPGAAGGGWPVKLLYSFNGTDGDGPAGGVVAADGKLYGTTFRGGSNGAGTVFQLAP